MGMMGTAVTIHRSWGPTVTPTQERGLKVCILEMLSEDLVIRRVWGGVLSSSTLLGIGAG